MDIRRAILQVSSAARKEADLRLDHLNGGQVRVQGTSSGESVQGSFCDTLEDVGPLVAIRVLDDELEDVVWKVPNPLGAAPELAGDCRARKERSLCQ